MVDFYIYTQKEGPPLGTTGRSFLSTQMILKLSLNVQNLKIIRTHLIGTLSERETTDQGSHIRLTFIFAFARVFFFFVLFCVFLFFVLRAVLGFSLFHL